MQVETKTANHKASRPFTRHIAHHEPWITLLFPVRLFLMPDVEGNVEEELEEGWDSILL